ALAAETLFDVISLDWTVEPETARERVRRGLERSGGGRSVVLQGNLDPTVLFAEPEVIRERTREMCRKFGPAGHIANLGHGMMPTHDPNHLQVFLEAVHESSQALRN
ncbi:hypothetical protein EC988_006388, partial [Linderina pennispora]